MKTRVSLSNIAELLAVVGLCGVLILSVVFFYFFIPFTVKIINQDIKSYVNAIPNCICTVDAGVNK